MVSMGPPSTKRVTNETLATSDVRRHIWLIRSDIIKNDQIVTQFVETELKDKRIMGVIRLYYNTISHNVYIVFPSHLHQIRYPGRMLSFSLDVVEYTDHTPSLECKSIAIAYIHLNKSKLRDRQNNGRPGAKKSVYASSIYSKDTI